MPKKSYYTEITYKCMHSLLKDNDDGVHETWSEEKREEKKSEG